MYPFPGGKCSTDFFHTKCCNKKCSPSTHLVSNRLAQCPACQYYGPCHPVPANCWNVLAVFLHKMLSLLWEIVRIVGCHFQPLRVENYRAVFGQCSPRILKSVGSKPEKVICYFCSISISLPEYWRRSPKQEFKTTVICVSPIFHQPPTWPVSLCWGDPRSRSGKIPARSQIGRVRKPSQPIRLLLYQHGAGFSPGFLLDKWMLKHKKVKLRLQK